jgi:hypothetical protein
MRSTSNHEQTDEWTIKQPKLLSRKQEAYNHLSGFFFSLLSLSLSLYLSNSLSYGEKVAQKCAGFLSAPMACGSLKTTAGIFFTFDVREFY